MASVPIPEKGKPDFKHEISGFHFELCGTSKFRHRYYFFIFVFANLKRRRLLGVASCSSRAKCLIYYM